MDLIIPTRQRATLVQQTTWRTLTEAGLHPILVVRPGEADVYRRNLPAARIQVLPDTVDGIAATRDYIMCDMNTDESKVVMLDDDLHFARRRFPETHLFRPCTPADIAEMVDSLGYALDTHAHVGVGFREGGNRVTDLFVDNTRCMRVLAYRRDIVRKHHLFFMPMLLKQDFHMTLQLLRLGYNNRLVNTWVTNQAKGSDAPGGCSLFRTPELMSDMSHKLAELHPGFVKVVRKVTKGAWGGGTRTDVMVLWKQARKSAEYTRSVT